MASWFTEEASQCLVREISMAMVERMFWSRATMTGRDRAMPTSFCFLTMSQWLRLLCLLPLPLLRLLLVLLLILRSSGRRSPRIVPLPRLVTRDPIRPAILSTDRAEDQWPRCLLLFVLIARSLPLPQRRPLLPPRVRLCRLLCYLPSEREYPPQAIPRLDPPRLCLLLLCPLTGLLRLRLLLGRDL